jgi:beta-fructofuranosidase
MKSTFLYLSIGVIVHMSAWSQDIQESTSRLIRENEKIPDEVIISTREFRERLLTDPYRPAYHFCVPEDVGRPADPNGAFYYNGRYHLMYLYKRTGRGFAWGHVSSKDLLHWRHHPDAIGPGNGEDGVFSGGAFVNDQGKAFITYWQYVDQSHSNLIQGRLTEEADVFKNGKSGIAIAESVDEHFDHWTKSSSNPAIASTEWGLTIIKDRRGQELVYGSADPSQIWEKDGRYYMLTGNLLLLMKYALGQMLAPTH